MNMPSTIGGNWEWRMKAEDLTQERKDLLDKNDYYINEVINKMTTIYTIC